MIWILSAKVVIDGLASAWFVTRSVPMMLMFLGFAVADVGALWLAMRT